MISGILDLEELTLELEFSEARELRRAPTLEELRKLEAPDSTETPLEMTGNDAFRIIEVIKEREAFREA